MSESIAMDFKSRYHYEIRNDIKGEIFMFNEQQMANNLEIPPAKSLNPRM